MNNFNYSNLIDFLLQKNQFFNLTSIRNADEVMVKHIEDSQQISNYIKKLHSSSVNILDMGTGAGFPGLIIATENPDKSVFMADSSKKKIAFVEQAISLLNLKNAYSFHSRVENFALDKPFFFDIIVARSLAYTDTLLEYSTPLLKIGGYLLAMKSKDIDEELSSINHLVKPLGFSSPLLFKYLLSGSERYIVSFQKINSTDIKLPRRAGTANKKPLRRFLCV